MMGISLTEIQIIPIKPRNGLLAFASFVLNKAFYIGDVAIYSRLDGNGYRLVFPIKTLKNGFNVNIFHPINHESAQALEEPVIRAFAELIEKVTIRKGAVKDESATSTSTRCP
jgi:stage V sporulation protein G